MKKMIFFIITFIFLPLVSQAVCPTEIDNYYPVEIDGQCYGPNQACSIYLGENSWGTMYRAGTGDGIHPLCFCNTGYKYSVERNSCIKQDTYNQVFIPTLTHYYYNLHNKLIFTERPEPETIITSLIKGETDAATYYVDSQKKLRWIKNEDVAKKYFGPNWDRKIIWFSDSIIYTYQFGETID